MSLETQSVDKKAGNRQESSNRTIAYVIPQVAVSFKTFETRPKAKRSTAD